MTGVDIVHFPVPLIPNHQQVLRIEHAQTLIHIVERDVESKILLSQFLPNAPSRHRPNKADTEAADDGCQGNGDRAGRHGIGVNDSIIARAMATPSTPAKVTIRQSRYSPK